MPSWVIRSTARTLQRLIQLQKRECMAVRKLRRGVLPKKHKHAHVLKTIYVSPSTPFAAALKRVDKVLDSSHNQKQGRARIVGLGRAIQTVLQVASGLMERKYPVSIRTLTLSAVDERINEEKGTSAFEHRQVPAAELLVGQKLNV